ncbi:MAG: transporter substrate-binding domain-containing protein [Desulfobacterales bacterium]|nr:transporter substrate-binding domain-containing protein [Desulfobacterales bacterium]
MKFKTIVFIFLLFISNNLFAKDTLTITLRNDLPPLTFLSVEGKPSGLFVDIWKLWAEKTGRKIEFRSESWEDTIESLKNKQADIHGALYYSEERSQWMAFSQHIYEFGMSVFFPKNQKKINNIIELKGHKIGIITGSAQEQELSKKCPEIEFIPFINIKDMIYSIREGKIRAFISTPASVLVILSQLGLSGDFDSTNESLFSRKIHAGVLKENKELINIIDKGFDIITNHELAEIESRWVLDPSKRYYRNPAIIRLTETEEKWLKQNKTVKVTIPIDYPPIMFIGEDKTFHGMIPDYIKIVASRIGIHFDLGSAPITDLPELIKNKKTDIVLAFMSIQPDRLNMNLTDSFFSLTRVIINRIDAPFVRNVKDLKGKKVSLIKNASISKQIIKDYPEIILYPKDKPYDTIYDVSRGKTDAYVGSNIVAGYIIQKHNFSNLKIAGHTGYEDFLLRFAVRNDFPELLSILNKAIHSITQKEHDEIYKNNMPIRYEYAMSWSKILKWTFLLSVLFIIILGISIFWNRRLVKEISDRKKAENSLKESEEQFRNMFENHSAVMLLINPEDGIIMRANHAAEKYYGYSSKEFANLKIYQINQLKEDELSVIMEKVRNYKQNCFHFKHRLSNGVVKDVEVHSSPIQFKGKSILFSIVHDITERKELENQLVNARKLESIAILAAGIAHNFNNLLAPIIAGAQLIDRDIPKESPIKPPIELILTSSKRAKNLIKEILNFSRDGRIKKTTIDLNILLEETLNFLNNTIPSNIQIQNSLETLPVKIKADPNQIQQALINLCTNSYNAMKKQNYGLLNIKLSKVELKDGSYACITVTDNGHGIPKNLLPKIFEPFFTTSTKVAEGSGLGLATVQKIINDNDGVITVESEIGKGTTFKLFFPISLDFIISQNKDIPLNIKGRGHLLVVDDDVAISNLFKILLRKYGYTADFKNDSIEALEIFKIDPNKYNTVILDNIMPNKSGIDLSLDILNIRKNIPIIMITGNINSISEEKIKEIGIKKLITKPFDIETILNAIDESICSL